MSTIRKVLLCAMWLLTLAGSILLLLAWASYYWLFWPLLNILSIIVPLLWGFCGLAVILWLFENWKRSLLPFLVLLLTLICFPSYIRYWPFDSSETSSTSLRIASYNLGNLDSESVPWNTLKNDLQQATESLGADILCFQELKRDLTYKLNGYPYRYFSPEVPGKSNQAIFSEYPIVNSGTIKFSDSPNNAIYADIVVRADTIRVYNVHLQSYRIRSGRDMLRDSGKPILKRISEVARRHSDQANLVKSHQEASGLSSIICGDFNSTAFSHTYNILNRGMQDSFTEHGKGLGATYFRKDIPFRIDYILADPTFEVEKHQVHELWLSDHFPVSANLRLQ